jgi:hypothetical protein
VKIITLSNMKALANVTFSAQDAALTLAANGVEADVEKYLERDLDSLTGAESSSIEYNLTASAVLKWQDPGYDIWAKGILARALFPFRVPAIGVGSTS